MTSHLHLVDPAEVRVRGALPAGLVFVEGRYFELHRIELIDFILKRAASAVVAHPGRRVMGAKDTSEGVVFGTTEPQLAEDIGDALRTTFAGDILFSYTDSRDQLRVHWRR